MCRKCDYQIQNICFSYWSLTKWQSPQSSHCMEVRWRPRSLSLLSDWDWLGSHSVSENKPHGWDKATLRILCRPSVWAPGGSTQTYAKERRKEERGKGSEEKKEERGQRKKRKGKRRREEVSWMNIQVYKHRYKGPPWIICSMVHQQPCISGCLGIQGYFEWGTKEKSILNFLITLKLTKIHFEMFAFSQKIEDGVCNWCEKSLKN